MLYATVCGGIAVAVYAVVRYRKNRMIMRQNDLESIIGGLGKYFRLREMFRSDTAESRGIDNTTKDKNILLNLKALVENVLDPVRERYGKPINVTSGYRCQKLNAILNPNTSTANNQSQHTKGEAADVSAGSKEENKTLFNLIKSMGKYDQLINENDYSWVHVSWKRNGKNRKQILKV